MGIIESPQGGLGVDKMARLPRGSVPLANFAGMAPGILLSVPRAWGDALRLFLLPGVPREMKAIFDEVVAPIHLKGLGETWHTETVKHDGEESELFPLLDRLEREMPSVVIGSYPKFGKLEVTLRVSGTKEDVTRAVGEIRGFLEDHKRRLAR
jgi:nicotinamide-nucleotide amidase